MGVGHAVVGAADRDVAVAGVGGQAVALGGHGSGREAEHAEDAGSDDERLAAAGKGLAEGLDGCAVGAGGAGEIPGEGDVMLEREVDDAVGRARGVAEDVEVVERSRAHFGARGPQGLGRSAGAGEAGDDVAGGDQVGDEPAADPAGCSGDKNTHGNLQMSGACLRGARRRGLMSAAVICTFVL